MSTQVWLWTVASPSYQTRGGGSYGGRDLYPVLPYLALVIHHIPDDLEVAQVIVA